MQRINALAEISEELDRLTRTFCSPAMRCANDLVATWMRAAGMSVREDAIGNIIGRFPSKNPLATDGLLSLKTTPRGTTPMNGSKALERPESGYRIPERDSVSGCSSSFPVSGFAQRVGDAQVGVWNGVVEIMVGG